MSHQQHTLSSSSRIGITPEDDSQYLVSLDSQSVANIAIHLDDHFLRIYQSPHPLEDDTMTTIKLPTSTDEDIAPAAIDPTASKLTEFGITPKSYSRFDFSELLTVSIDGQETPVLAIDFSGTVPFVLARSDSNTRFGSSFSDNTFAGYVVNESPSLL
jgi:hypothetical protein